VLGFCVFKEGAFTKLKTKESVMCKRTTPYHLERLVDWSTGDERLTNKQPRQNPAQKPHHMFYQEAVRITHNVDVAKERGAHQTKEEKSEGTKAVCHASLHLVVT